MKLSEKGVIEMASKFLHSLSDDNADLQRQIGCMTGIFQLFDRQQIISARRITGVGSKRVPSGRSRTYGSDFDESNSIYHRSMPKENNSTKSVYEHQRISVESSRPFFSSSSRSSSFSSLDCNTKINQSDPSPYDQIIFPETPSRDPPMSQTEIKYEPSDFNKSLRVLAKYREAPWNCDENLEHSRTSYVSNNTRRFSYDGRETIRSAPKHKELPPRLSLDGREGSRSFNSDHKPAGPSVVAKLMGLETLADAGVATSKQFSKPVSNYTKNLVMEPAPWKLPEDSQKPSFRKLRTQTKPSVYSEIEKRIKDVEFSQSGKDLRALKQILEAMQAKGLLDNSTRREGQDSNFTTQSEKEARFLNKERAFESPIVIMKPSKLVPKSGKGNLNNSKNLANNKISKEQVSKIRIKENGANVLNSRKSSNSVKTSASLSPRLQENKLELEKRSRPPISPDSNKAKKQVFKNQAESSSPGEKRRPKFVKKPQNDDRSSVSSDSKGSFYQDDGLEVTSSGRFSERNGGKSRSLMTSNYAVSGLVQQKFVEKSLEGEFSELGSVAREQPSPVSVLDDTMYADEASSPVKQIPDVLEVTGEVIITNNPDREENKHEEHVYNTTINRKKLENIENLVKKLRRVNSTHDETHTDYIASLCEYTNPDYRYVSEILLASGLLLRDLNSSQSIFELHSSGYPINPELFLVLEQTKASNIVHVKCDEEKFHRKLIFDAVNEILAKKLNLLRNRTKKLTRRCLSAQKLLRDLCCEIESLQMKKPSFSFEDEEDCLRSVLCEDVMNRSEIWNDFGSDLSGLVLDIERLVFKDLITEIVRGEDVRIKEGRRCRQLFA